mmetsp:Transcript_20999/g.37406  ORF Transcript_20999/g.37406 Transcript_20999/m.37406 type:complete len:285 (-) Transcript_20999:156-1010(-)|eukprot:CAMPEP_0197522060 /NCGR_PEP_ID=MMETSP1318-20131121/7254_1 /TAXON_ID=552666 /ORGANISM="Partenskyella glossopodia, Strain RCC365" /LENGTH=284 /DNA_ID=CAMNT_0043074283 /DNA_START=15 /DNA_END=869 /DNA_ORIENTATION=+
MAEEDDTFVLAPQRGRNASRTGTKLGGWRSSRTAGIGKGNSSGLESEKKEAKSDTATESAAEKKGVAASGAAGVSVGAADAADEKGETKVMQPPEGESPLENSWCFWFDKRARVKGVRSSYESNLKRIGAFCTVEGMWGYLNHMTKPTQVELGANYHLFKDNIKPMWEDKANANGGKWVVQIKGGRHHLDTYWLNLVLGLAGETIDDGDEICGAVMSRRRQGDRIAIWNRNKASQEVIMRLGKRIKETISHSVTPTPSFSMEYAYHDDSIKSGHSYANPKRYTL